MVDPDVAVEQVLRRAGLLETASTVVAATCPLTGPVMWAKGCLLDGTPVTIDTPLYAASLTKQLVATLAAQQVLAGALDVTTSVRDLLPELPPWAGGIQVRHLIHHTSGMPTIERTAAALRVPGHSELNNKLVMAGLAQLAAPEGPPGRVLSYSNVGYIVLAEAVRAIANTSLAELACRRIFMPLDMTDSHLGQGAPAVTADDLPPPGTVGDGGWWTSARALLRWLDALNHERLGADLTRLVQTPGHLDDGTPLNYAWGITVRPAREGAIYTHGGNWPGASAKTVRNPTTRTAVVLLTTHPDVDLVSGTATAIHDQLRAT